MAKYKSGARRRNALMGYAAKYALRKAGKWAVSRIRKGGYKTRLGMKRRVASGYGKTKRRKYGKTSVVGAEIDHGMNSSYFQTTLRKKKPGAVSNWVEYTQENSQTISGPAGGQAAGMVAIDFSSMALNINDQTLADGPHPGQYRLPLWGFNTMNYQQTSFAPPNLSSGPYPAPNTNKPGQKLFIKSVYYEVMVCNAANVTSDVTLYCVTSKKPMLNNALPVSDPYKVWNQLTSGIFGETISADSNANSVGGIAVSTRPVISDVAYTYGTPGRPNLNTVGWNPFKFKAIQNSYKKLYSKSVKLSTGSTHKFKLKITLNKWLYEEEVRNLLGNYDSVNGFTIPFTTIQLFIIAQGQPMLVRRQGEAGTVDYTVNRAVTISPVQIAWTATRKIKFGFATGQSQKIQYHAVNFEELAGNAAGAIVNVEDDVVEEELVN